MTKILNWFVLVFLISCIQCSANRKLNSINEQFAVLYAESCSCPSLCKIVSSNDFVNFIHNVEVIIGNEEFFLVKSRVGEIWQYNKFDNHKNYYREDIIEINEFEFRNLVESMTLIYKYDYSEYFNK